MKLSVYCVKDRATDVYGTPMFLIAAGQAIRSFTDEVNRDSSDNQLFMHPDDFDLYELGSWDSESGEFQTAMPFVLVRGKDVSLKFVEGK